MADSSGSSTAVGAGQAGAAQRDKRPLPLQIRDGIQDLIERDRLSAGDQLPSEAELAERFNVGRTTVREALKLLEQDAVIDVRHGLGRFVSPAVQVVRPITRLESVTEMMAGLGLSVTNQVLDVTERPATDQESTALHLASGAPVIALERLRLTGEELVIYSVDVVPRRLIDGPLAERDWTGSLIALLDLEGHDIALASAQISATTLPRPVVRRLPVTVKGPWLLMVQTSVSQTGEPVIYSTDYHRGDRFTFRVLRRRTP